MKKIVQRIMCIILVVVLILPFGMMSFSSLAASSKEDAVRYTALILDTSGSMSGVPAQKQKEAAIKFCESMLNSKGNNYICIIKLNQTSVLGLDFTDSLDDLTTYINKIPASGGTNINQALLIADTQLSSVVQSGVIKNVVLCSDGLPESGNAVSSGPYTSSGYSDFKYANAAYNTADNLKSKYSVYTLGFFHALSGSDLAFGRRFMNDIQNAGYYEVTDPDELVFKFGEIAGEITSSMEPIEFTYQSGKDYTAICYYSDSYFSESSYTYNPSLATMSISLAMSAFGSGDESSYANKSINAKNLLKKIGIDENKISTNEWFKMKPTTDSIGVIAGNKQITINNKDYTLIALAIRGGGYEQEWASNFTIGSSGQHSGFNRAKNNVITFLKDYILEQKISGPVKLWITGYSRAAATANLVGGEIDKGITLSPNISYELSDVYTYTFETPAGALTNEIENVKEYNNIFNIINQSDPVPYVAPAALGFDRYGKDKYLPSAQASGTQYESLKSKMLEVYNSLDSINDPDIDKENRKEYVVDDFQMKKIVIHNAYGWLSFGNTVYFTIQDDKKNNLSQGVFLSNYVTYLARDYVKTRNNYVEYYERGIREIFSILNGYNKKQIERAKNSLVVQFKNNSETLIFSAFSGNLETTLSNWIKKALSDAGIKDYNSQAIDSVVNNVAPLLIDVLVGHPNYATTAFLNLDGIGGAHYPELCYSWLASMDRNYSPNNSSVLNNGGYRIIRINCAVDIKVEDENGNMVASIIDETPVNLSNGCLSGVDENGQKYVILPIDEGYTVSVTGREDDLVNFGISEYSAEAGEFTRNINYFDIDVDSGETITGTIPSYSATEINGDTPNGSSVNYVLYDSSNKKIKCDSDVSTKNGIIEYYAVSATSSNDNYGYVSGGNSVMYGEYVQLEAFTLDNAVFDGWYIDGECVSTDLTYRMCVKENINVVGKFSKGSSFLVKFLEFITNLLTKFFQIISLVLGLLG